jgi:Activator of Hsp90 ATPase homolog 1-like protein
MITTGIKIEDLTLNVTEEIHVRATLEATFAALLEQLGPFNETAEDKSMPMKIEPWPGGRWYRDLGDGNGHFWGSVQAIKRPTLLEITGPLFMSYPVSSNVQYRLSQVDGGTLIQFRHSALGLIQEDHRKGVTKGWGHINAGVKKRAEAPRSRSTAS